MRFGNRGSWKFKSLSDHSIFVNYFHQIFFSFFSVYFPFFLIEHLVLLIHASYKHYTHSNCECVSFDFICWRFSLIILFHATLILTRIMTTWPNTKLNKKAHCFWCCCWWWRTVWRTHTYIHTSNFQIKGIKSDFYRIGRDLHIKCRDEFSLTIKSLDFILLISIEVNLKKKKRSF